MSAVTRANVAHARTDWGHVAKNLRAVNTNPVEGRVSVPMVRTRESNKKTNESDGNELMLFQDNFCVKKLLMPA